MARQQVPQSKLREVANVLKREGIGAPIDTRKKINPTAIRGGKTLKEWAKKLKGVLSGNASIVKASQVKGQPGYKKLYERAKTTKGELLIVPHSPDESVRVQSGKVVITHPSGIERIQLPVPYHNLEQYLSDNHGKIGNATGNSRYAFRFYGGSSGVFRDMDDLLDVLLHYNAVEAAIDEDDRKLQRDMYRNLEIVRTFNTREWFERRRTNIDKDRKKKRRRRI